MATKGKAKGRYMTKVGFYDIYAKYTYRPKKEGASKFESPEIASTDFVIYHSNKIAHKGMSSINLAIDKAKELLGSKYREVYNIK